MKGRPYPESVRAEAHRLRREGLSFAAVAERLGLPQGTVKGWLSGEGEARYVQTCWCGKPFIAVRADALSCSPAHSAKRWKTFGPVRRSAPATMAAVTGATGP